MKKGKASWKPARLADVYGKKPGYVYRWCDKDRWNIARRQEDGWILASVLQGDTSKHRSEDETKDGKSLTTNIEHRERVLMMIPDEDYQEHRAYFDNLTKRQTVGLKKTAQQELTDAARGQGAHAAVLHGNIIIE